MSEVELWYLGVEGHNPSEPRYPVLLDTDPDPRREGFGRTDHRDGTIWYAREIGNLDDPNHSVNIEGHIVGAYKIEINVKAGEILKVKLGGFGYEIRHRSISKEKI